MEKKNEKEKKIEVEVKTASFLIYALDITTKYRQNNLPFGTYFILIFENYS